jgi:hypothetical protein
LGGQHGQHLLDDSGQSEDVDVEQVSHLLRLPFLDGAEVAVSGVVDQHVDAVEGFDGVFDTSVFPRSGTEPHGWGR